MNLSISDEHVGLAAANRQNLDLSPVNRIATQRVDEADHDGIVCPNSAVGETPLAISIDGEECRGGRCGERDGDQLFAPVQFKIRMVGRLEDMNLCEAVKSRDAEPGSGLTKLPGLEQLAQFAL